MFLIISVGSVSAHIIISTLIYINDEPTFKLFNLVMNLWCHDKTSDRVFTFNKWRAEFAFRFALLFQFRGHYTYPTVIERLVMNEDVTG